MSIKQRGFNFRVSVCVLVAVFILGMLPMPFGGGCIAEATGTSYIYNFLDSADWPMDTTYTDTSNTWRFIADSEGRNPDATGDKVDVQNLQLQFPGLNQWIAFGIKISTAGTYHVEFIHKANKNGTGTRIYFMSPTEDIQSALVAGEEIGTADFRKADVTYGISVTLADITVDTPGEYYLVFSRDYPTPTGNRYIYPQELHLTLATPIDSAELILAKDSIGVGETINSTVSGQLADDTEADLTSAQITYESTDDSVVAVDNEGNITGIAAGTADITVTVNLFGNTVSDIVSITVTDNYIIYDFIKCANWPMDTTYTNTNNTWRFIADSEGRNPDATGDKRVSRGVQFQFPDLYQWVAVGINIPNPGRYQVSLVHAAASSGTRASLYFMSPTANIEAGLTVENEIGTANFQSSTSTYDINAEMTDIIVDTAGEYYLIFSRENPAQTGIRYIYPSSLVISKAPPALSTVNMNLIKSSIKTGETTSIEVSGLLDDESTADLSGASISYESLSPAIAAVDGVSGAVTGISAGSATIKATVTLDGLTVSDTEIITVTAVSETITTGQIRIGADGVNNGVDAVNINGITYGNFGGFENFNVGSEVTLDAAETFEGKEFLYWKNSASNRIISANKQFTFKIGTATNITAIYRDTDAGNYLVEFVDRNGKVLKSEYLNDGEPIEQPEAPFSVGYIFDKWNPNVPATATADGTYVAQYNNDPATYTVGVANGTILPDGGEYTYNTLVTVTASLDAGQKFAYWTKDGAIVSYDAEYSFYVWDNTEVTAVGISESDNVTPVPAIYMDKPKIEVLEPGDPAILRLMLLAERTLPEGYDLVETGILVSEINNEPTLADYDLKAISQSTDKNGQFTTRLEAISQDTVGYARAYMVFKSPTGDYQTIYSNVIGGAVI